MSASDVDSIPAVHAVHAVLLWSTDRHDRQRALIDAMRAEAPAMTGKPGFLSLDLKPSEDGRRVVVEGVWASRAAFEAATAEPPGGGGGREELMRHGRLDEIVITTLAARFGSPAGEGA